MLTKSLFLVAVCSTRLAFAQGLDSASAFLLQMSPGSGTYQGIDPQGKRCQVQINRVEDRTEVVVDTSSGNASTELMKKGDQSQLGRSRYQSSFVASRDGKRASLRESYGNDGYSQRADVISGSVWLDAKKSEINGAISWIRLSVSNFDQRGSLIPAESDSFACGKLVPSEPTFSNTISATVQYDSGNRDKSADSIDLDKEASANESVKILRKSVGNSLF